MNNFEVGELYFVEHTRDVLSLAFNTTTDARVYIPAKAIFMCVAIAPQPICDKAILLTKDEYGNAVEVPVYYSDAWRKKYE